MEKNVEKNSFSSALEKLLVVRCFLDFVLIHKRNLFSQASNFKTDEMKNFALKKKELTANQHLMILYKKEEEELSLRPLKFFCI